MKSGRRGNPGWVECGAPTQIASPSDLRRNSLAMTIVASEQLQKLLITSVFL